MLQWAQKPPHPLRAVGVKREVHKQCASVRKKKIAQTLPQARLHTERT